MEENYDGKKVLQLLFDPQISEILSELEDGKKESLYLSKKFNLTENELRNILDYLIKHNFIIEKKGKTKLYYNANSDKLAKVMENDKNFQSVVDGLTEMDSYLN